MSTRIAIVGAGPAGFYAAGHLLAASEQIEVDMIERLPTPWGLVRSGVAPDHPKIKSVTRVYEKTAAKDRFRYFGNVELGSDVSREELLAHYHAVVYATGSPTDRPLGIPGEDLPGSHSATDFVGWYNGHPDFRDLQFDLSCERAVVIGNGNVAIDVARMLTLSREELAQTDIADHALHALEESAIEEIVLVGRRGPAQAAFTNPELLELGELADADVIVDGDELERALQTPDPHMEPTAERNVKILRDYAARTPAGRRRRIVLRFLRSPVELRGDQASGVREIVLARNELVEGGEGRLRARDSGDRETLQTGLVFRAIGYRGLPLPGVPFDERTATISNERGRVVDPGDGRPLAGEYTVGWIKRGPSGVIGTNKKDAQETVDVLLEDLAAGRLAGPAQPSREAAKRASSPAQPDGDTAERPSGPAQPSWETAERPSGPAQPSRETAERPSNLRPHQETAERPSSPAQPSADAAERLLRERVPDLVTYEAWQTIDRHEQSLGEPQGRPRVKLTRIEHLLRAAAGETPTEEPLDTLGLR